jgi:uroporphyrin-III C-methyltransferase
VAVTQFGGDKGVAGHGLKPAIHGCAPPGQQGLSPQRLDQQRLDQRSAGQQGEVVLIGAGPGDPELLTLKAVRHLGRADVILIDDLVNREILAHARPGARVVAVGKRGGCKSTPQEFIERLMVRHARQGRVVARVKGGDPFVFGRGGEEVEALKRAGIAYEVVSGITSGIGAPASFGIPVTHRDCAPGVTLITGHLQRRGSGDRAGADDGEGDSAGPNWRALVEGGTTLVIYMGMTRLQAICAALIEAGMAADMPAAAVQSGTTATERCVVAPLHALAAGVREAGLASPAIVVVGRVAALADASRSRLGGLLQGIGSGIADAADADTAAADSAADFVRVAIAAAA